MKKFIAFIVLCIATTTFAQGRFPQQFIDSTATKNNFDVYVSPSLSIGNSNGSTFEQTSYASVEFGVCKNDVSYGVVLGRANLDFKGKDNVNNYWYEAKVSPSFPLGKLNGFVLLGVGNYVDTKKIFIEYGGGFSCKPKKITYFAQVSNWDGLWYMSPGISFNL